MRKRGHTRNCGLATVQAEIADAAMDRLLDEYVRLYRAKQAEELRMWKRDQIARSPAATARLRFLERQAEARSKAAA
jgi:hypothetical protein